MSTLDATSAEVCLLVSYLNIVFFLGWVPQCVAPCFGSLGDSVSMNKLEKEFKNSNKYDNEQYQPKLSIILAIIEVVAANGLLQAFGFVTSIISELRLD
ncbi:hypothetical protein K1719_038109 [Acacia pycnantha]|nr:hypothetical protein K1719_038109 [Acacia pycnantha]